MSLASGQKLGPYEIVSPLGAGGMGEVYRARDTRLDRDVAVKVLPEHMARDAQALARFEREAKSVAALSHPHILAVYDVGQHENISYVVMELLEGETLRSRISRSALPSRKATEIGIEIAEGLSAAHTKGVIHRDLKPENIFLTAGHVKILDFGLARSTEPVQGTTHDLANSPTMTIETRPGAIIGTLCYMAPEQIRAQATDARTDIFAFGCVMYEMLTGKRAFLGETAADTMTAILKEEPTSVRTAASGVGLELERLIDRCLEKRPEQRFQSSADLAYSLRSLLSHSGIAASDPARRPWVGRAAIALVVVAALIVSVWMVRRELRQTRLEGRESIDSIAVLPLENVSRDPEQEYFADGMTEALISDLAKIGGLKVISRTSVMRYKGTTKSLPEIAKELNVDAVVEGSVLRVGERVRITAQLIHAATDEHLWSESYDRDLRDVLRLHSELARTIAKEIKVSLTPQEQARMVAARPINPEAYQAYLKGRFHWNKRTSDGLKKSVEYFEQAVSLDPDWPLAYAGLADTYAVMPYYSLIRPREAMPKAQAAAAKALQMDESLAEAHASLALIATNYDWNWPIAEREFKRAIALSPNYATAHHWYERHLLVMGRYDEAIKEITIAHKLDPLSLVISVNVGGAHYFAGDYEQAETLLRQTVELGPDWAVAHRELAITLLARGKLAEATTEAQEAARLSGNDPYHAAILGHVCAKAGQAEEARRILNELTARSAEAYVAPSLFALVHAGADEKDRMFDWFERAYQEHDVLLPFLLRDPLLAEWRGDPRLADLVRRVGLPPHPAPRGADPPASPLSKGGQRGVPSGKIMLAVLPFENLSRDPDQDYLSDGLTEEMIARLGQLNPKRLGVIARTSAMHYKNTTKTIDAIGRELSVAYIVEGSVRRAGDRVRITAQLIAVSDQTHLWAENYERDLKDIFALQSDVAERIAESLSVELLSAPAAAARHRTINAEAYQAYLKGRFHWNKRTRDGLQKAVEYFEQAIALSPDWPLGYAGLADAYLLMPWYSNVRSSEANPKARMAAAKALEMDESLAEAHATMAVIVGDYDRDWPTAEREFQRALALSPNYATAHQWYGLQLRFRGRHDEALREATKAQELDPLSLIISVNVGEMHYCVGDWVQAEAQFRKTLEFAPDFVEARVWLAHTLFLQARIAEAITEAREAVRSSNNDPRCVSTLGYVYAKSGQTEEARRILDEITARSKEAYVAPTHFALVHAGLEERDRMFEWLERAYEEHDVRLLDMLIDPLLAGMRSDPRFADLIRRVGIPPLPVPRGSDPPASALDKGGQRGVTAGDKHTLAVLPFVNQSGNPDDEYFSDGMADELATALMKVPGLRVAARSSAFTFKGKNVEAREIGAKLGVGTVLEGTVRRSGPKLRVTAQLVNAEDGMVRWSEKYEREAEDVFAVQDDITRNIVAALQLKLGVGSATELRAGRTENPEAHDLYLRGRFLAFKQTEEGLRKGLEYFEKAIKKDPGYAPAYAGMTYAYMWFADGFASPRETYPKAKEAVVKALELDSTNAEAHAYLGLIQWFFDWEFESMDAAFRRAVQLNPNSMEAHNSYALALCGMRRFDEGLAEADRAIVLDPLSPVPSWTREYCLVIARRYDDVIAQNRKTAELDPNFFYLESLGALAYREKGMLSESVAEYQRLRRNLGDQPMYGLAITYARMGRTAEARDILKELLELSKRKYVSPDQIALIYAALGEKDEAFAWLDRAYEARSGWMTVWLLGLPDYDSLRSDPRFEALLRKIGFKK